MLRRRPAQPGVDDEQEGDDKGGFQDDFFQDTGDIDFDAVSASDEDDDEEEEHRPQQKGKTNSTKGKKEDASAKVRTLSFYCEAQQARSVNGVRH
eukprot:7013116-Pyramimonas_sp.AAC.1